MNFLNRISLDSKFLVAPVIGLSVMIFLSMVLMDTLIKQDATISDAITTELETMESAATILSRLSVNHTGIYELLKYAEVDSDEEQLYERGKPLLNEIYAINKALDDPRFDHIYKQFEQTYSKSFLDEFHRYQELAITAIEMASVELELTRNYIGDASSAFNKLNAQYLRLLKKEHHHIQEYLSENIAKADVLTQRFYWILAVIGFGMILLSIMLAHFFSRDLNLMIASLTRLTTGDRDIDIPVAGLSPEIKDMAKAIDIFKRSLDDLDRLNEETLHINKSLVNEIGERKRVEEELEHLAYHDTLTELPNRALFLDRLEHALERRCQTGHKHAVMFIDLDRFKVINDTLGHDSGDRLLQSTATMLQACVRQGDTVARLGGDEFAILIEDLTSVRAVTVVANKIKTALLQPFSDKGHDLFITASIGISLYPSDGEDANVLLKNADTAMYRAKDMGRNNHQFYSADMSKRSHERLTLESSLHHALERKEFLMFYQPQVDIQSDAIIGMESLIRWQHTGLGLVSPLDFIPMLEETGLIVPVGEWVLETVCAQTKLWQSGQTEFLRVAVNLSGRQFSSPNLAKQIRKILDKTGLPPECLEMEITESTLMKDDQLSLGNMAEIRDMGIQMAIDDFGTGYSSLSYLKRFPIDTIKIDRSFIRHIGSDDEDSAIVTAIISMAHSLKLKVVAEGVETQEQLSFLQDCQCDIMQGYLFSKPLPADKMSLLLESHRKGFNEVWSI